MVPIWLTGREGVRGYQLDEFEAYFAEICEAHRHTDRALVFGLILADERTPQIAKVLADSVYWDALDSEAGDRISVFCLHVAPDNSSEREQVSRAGSVGLVSRVVGQLSDVDRFNRIAVAPEAVDSLPAILLFQIMNRQVSNARVVHLTKVTVEQSFLEIQDVIRKVSLALSRVMREAADPATVFWLVDEAMKQRSVILTAKEVLKLVPYLGRVLYSTAEG